MNLSLTAQPFFISRDLNLIQIPFMSFLLQLCIYSVFLSQHFTYGTYWVTVRSHLSHVALTALTFPILLYTG